MRFVISIELLPFRNPKKIQNESKEIHREFKFQLEILLFFSYLSLQFPFPPQSLINISQQKIPSKSPLLQLFLFCINVFKLILKQENLFLFCDQTNGRPVVLLFVTQFQCAIVNLQFFFLISCPQINNSHFEFLSSLKLFLNNIFFSYRFLLFCTPFHFLLIHITSA